MLKKIFLCILAAVMLAIPVSALEVDSDSIYCFQSADFARELTGVCIRSLPDNGVVLLGTRVIQPGDILTAGQLAEMTFCPANTQTDTTATVEYLPIFSDRVEQPAQLTISIRGKKDNAPTARNVQLETYRNIPNEGRLKATDPEGKGLKFSILRQPRQGDVEVAEDGSFTYTPHKNKVGVDSFTYTATDPAGNVSGEATVTIRILKPTEGDGYTDTVGTACQFEAEWLRSTGLFSGEQVGGKTCFRPEKWVSLGEFTALLMEVLQVPSVADTSQPEFVQNAPLWLKPYLAAALRSGLLTTLREDYDAPITGAEAAAMLNAVLELPMEETDTALTVLQQQGFDLSLESPLTRADLACILYQLSITDTPGKALFAQ